MLASINANAATATSIDTMPRRCPPAFAGIAIFRSEGPQA